MICFFIIDYVGVASCVDENTICTRGNFPKRFWKNSNLHPEVVYLNGL